MKMNFELALSQNQSEADDQEEEVDLEQFTEMYPLFSKLINIRFDLRDIKRSLHKLKKAYKLYKDIDYLDAKYTLLKKLRKYFFLNYEPILEIIFSHTLISQK
jgi:GTP1/Obg family GTP-binding protein